MRGWSTVGVALFALAVNHQVVAGQQQQSTFRAGVEVVSLDVHVERDGRPVTGLDAADFVVLDDGVSQAVQVVNLSEVPVDVTLVHDTSPSQAGRVAIFDRAIGTIMSRLSAADRLRRIRFGAGRVDISPWYAGGASIGSLPGALPWVSPVYDAIAAALLHRPTAQRRHLVVALTDAEDAGSVTSAEALRGLALRTGAVLDLVVFGREHRSTGGVRAWTPTGPDPGGRGELKDTAELTGGKVLDPLFGNPDPVGAVLESVSSFRASYLVYFIPDEEPTPGWHELSVAVPSQRGATIRARAGYFAQQVRPHQR